MNDITLTSSLLPVREYSGQRVVTFKDIDTVHQRPTGTARRNFNKNRSRFIEGEDFFKICADEIRTHKITEISSKTREDITLITESGYLMLVKSFTDDLSWNVQRQLVNSYFHNKQTQAEKAEIKQLSERVKSAVERLEQLEDHIFELEKIQPHALAADDTIQRFIDECCMKRINYSDGITTARTYDAFCLWCSRNNTPPMSRRGFIAQLMQFYNGVCKFDIRGTINGFRYYKAFTLKPEYRSEILSKKGEIKSNV